MKILSHFQHFNLTSDQHNALEKLDSFLKSDDRIFILNGYAGTGKTTLLKGFVEYLQSIDKRYQLMAPTGRAAEVITQKTGFTATTIHRGIYNFGYLEEIEHGEDETDVTFLYKFNLRDNADVYNSVLIVDEASMVGNTLNEGEFFKFGSGYLLNDLIDYSKTQEVSTSSKIIFIGDSAQLPPVGMNSSPALDLEYLNNTYGIEGSMVEMKEVKRQDADNGILNSASKIRQCLTSGFFNDFDLRENKRDLFNPAYHEFLDVYKAETSDKIIICYKNKTALELNKQIREDKFGEDLHIQKTDTVIIGANNYKLGIMNGEFAIVSEVSPNIVSRDVRFNLKGGGKHTEKLTWREVTLVFPERSEENKVVSSYMLENFLYGGRELTRTEHLALYIDFKQRNSKIKKGTEEFKEALINDEFINCIKLKYGYAVTCHKAQGGEWNNAFVFWDRGSKADHNFYDLEHNSSGKTNSDFYRWAYTAITRASKKLFCVNPPYFSSFSDMSFIDVNVQNALRELEGKNGASVEVDFIDALPGLERFGLENASLTIQNHFIERWYLLKKLSIDISSWQRKGYEIWYQFKKGDEICGVKYSINGKDIFNKTYFLKLPKLSNSDQLYENVIKAICDGPKIEVNRDNVEGMLSQIEFDVTQEEEKPFLKVLYDNISEELQNGERIKEINHLPYKDRYSFEKGEEVCVVDFLYDGKGFFKQVEPIASKCNSSRLLDRIEEIISNLKKR